MTHNSTNVKNLFMFWDIFGNRSAILRGGGKLSWLNVRPNVLRGSRPDPKTNVRLRLNMVYCKRKTYNKIYENILRYILKPICWIPRNFCTCLTLGKFVIHEDRRCQWQWQKKQCPWECSRSSSCCRSIYVDKRKVNSSVPPDQTNDFENVNCTNCECSFMSSNDLIPHNQF